MALPRVILSVWLKLIAPLPLPNWTHGEEIIPAVSLPPRAPMFRVPAEPVCHAILIPPDEILPPLTTVSDPDPELPIIS